ncbi:UbiA prenyltransferase family [Moelleriella libera RCEF 2490]|uniref:UbiA prenyltransferase family n=1 Tax=Moelleriella libera RCEF 2490 TaxID=1081109 RepID=A0A166VF82_9HYPO|nr:UbiA prenyltransferase family [Moelleriella libera RCEF 2490]
MGPTSVDLTQHYGGRHTGSWVMLLPVSWIPYIQLARLSPPAGLCLIYFPHLFGAILGAITTRAATGATTRASAVLLLGTIFLSNAAHAWNDIVDEPFDRAVARTRMRPIVRGAITRQAALLFVLSQAIGGLTVLATCFPPRAVWYALPNILAIGYYPMAKQHTYFAQFVLGICIAWGVFVGAVSVGHEPFVWGVFRLSANPSDQTFTVDAGIACIFLACVLWTVIYDSVYAFQDVEDDMKLGLKSMAVLLQGHTKPAIGFLLVCMVSFLALCGWCKGFGAAYFVLSITGPSLVLGAMCLRVDLRNPASCWWWFKHAFWAVGWSIAQGLLTQFF